MKLEERIERLENQIQEKTLPAMYFKKLQDKIYKQLVENFLPHNESTYDWNSHVLQEGQSSLNFETLYSMMRQCVNNGNYFIFLCSGDVFIDCCNIDDLTLSRMNIKFLLENRLPNDIGYLIPVEDDLIVGEPVKFKREMYILKGE